MKLVRATDASKLRGVRIKELGRIAKEGEIFEVTDDRYRVLNGANRYKAKFVTLVRPTAETKEPEPKKSVTESKPSKPRQEITEEPEIWIIEPGKGKVKVGKDLKPIISIEELTEKLRENREPEPPKEPVIIEEIKVEEQVIEKVEEPVEKPKPISIRKGTKIEQLPKLSTELGAKLDTTEEK